MKGKNEKKVGLCAKFATRGDKATNVQDLPPYGAYVASLLFRIRMQRMSFIGIAALLLLFIVYLYAEKEMMTQKAMEKEYFLLPATLPNIISVRANTISDTLVYEFAEFFTRELANINYDDALVRYKNLEKYLNPSFRASFRRAYKAKIDLWQERRIDQSFVFDHIEKFERKTKTVTFDDPDGEKRELQKVHFTTRVWGHVRKYVDGMESPPYRERITLEFTTAPVRGDKSWLFEITDIRRDTAEEIKQQAQIQRELGDEGRL